MFMTGHLHPFAHHAARVLERRTNPNETRGSLSKSASLRLIVSGEIGVKEVERRIPKSEFDKEILPDPDSDDKAE
jgi:hypothetical protein